MKVSLVDVYCTVCGVWLMHDCTCGCVWQCVCCDVWCVFVYVCVRGYMGARMGCVYTSGEPFGKPQCTASTLFCQTYSLARINVPRLIARSPRRTHTGRCIHCIPAKKQMRHMSQAHTSTVSDNHAHMPLTDTDRVCVFLYVCL